MVLWCRDGGLEEPIVTLPDTKIEEEKSLATYYRMFNIQELLSALYSSEMAALIVLTIEYEVASSDSPRLWDWYLSLWGTTKGQKAC